MDADFVLDGTEARIDGDRVTVTAPDLEVNSPARRPGSGPNVLRRALVHDERDGLTINFGGDYPGGVSIGGPVRFDTTCIIPGIRLRDGDDAAYERDFFEAVRGLLDGHPVVKTIQLDDFEPDMTVVAAHGPVLKPLDLATEIRHLRDEIKDLKARLHALDSK